MLNRIIGYMECIKLIFRENIASRRIGLLLLLYIFGRRYNDYKIVNDKIRNLLDLLDVKLEEGLLPKSNEELNAFLVQASIGMKILQRKLCLNCSFPKIEGLSVKGLGCLNYIAEYMVEEV